MRFFTSFRDIGFLIDTFKDNPYSGIIILCVAVAVGIIGSLIYNRRSSR